jgi:hypothetical protein
MALTTLPGATALACDNPLRAQYCANYLYDHIVAALLKSSGECVLCAKPGSYKSWWSDALTDLERKSCEAHELWSACNCPRQGEVFMEMRRTKLTYKQAIKVHIMAGDNCLSNELNDLLLSKDITGFWHTWNAKMCHSGVSPVIDDVSDSLTIADKFAQMFKSNCLASSNDYPCEGSVRDQFSISLNNGGLERLEIATVDHCIAIMKKGKAPGVDGIETEHLIHAHPLLVMQLCILFNIVLQHAVVPNAFHHGIIVPVVKDRRGDATDINDYRAITLSSCISKLFELCIIELYGDKLVSSPLQFGFKKKLGTSHALYTMRSTIEYFVHHGSTVHVAFLDISKAFDHVDHAVLFWRLLDIGVPVNIVKLLSAWYNASFACVRWGSCLSSRFSLTSGVRQGGVLSPLLFNVYIID